MDIKEKLKINTERLKTLNKGINFLNIDKQQSKPKYYLNILLDVEQNLKKKIETIKVKTNLIEHSYWDFDIDKFIKKFDSYTKLPLVYMSRSKNRILRDNWDNNVNNLINLVRKETFVYSDIQFIIGDLAKEKLKEMNLDIKKEVKRMIGQQSKHDKENQELAERFAYLQDKYLTLKTFKERERDTWNKPKDLTQKIMITDEEYNSQLKVIEDEMKTIAKIFGLDLYDMKYITIKVELTFEEWFKDNEEDMRENYETYSDDEDSEYKDFDEYAKAMFEEFGNEEESYY